MDFTNIDRLLDPAPLSCETGFSRRSTGVLHIALRSNLGGCTSAMLRRWLASRPATAAFNLSHRTGNLSSVWLEGRPDELEGAIQYAEIRAGDLPKDMLAIQYSDPREAFDPARLDAAKSKGEVTDVLFARIGAGHYPPRKPDGAVIGSRRVDVCRDTPWGVVVRSHVFLGQDLPSLGLSPKDLELIFPDLAGPSLLRHMDEELRSLSRLLPGLFGIGDQGGGLPPHASW